MQSPTATTAVKKIYLHIGTHKTGTSAIQSFALRNAELLAGRGYIYPRSVLYLHGHHPLAWALGVTHPRADPDATARELFHSVLEEFEHSKAPFLILSSEDFEFLQRPEMVRDYLNAYDTAVVVYLRRQDRYLGSIHNHHLRMPQSRLTSPIEDFYNNRDFSRDFDYFKLLEPWVEAFGLSTMRVRPYDAITGAGRTIVTDFCATLGIDPSGLQGLERRPNSSIGVFASEALRLLNRTDLTREGHLSAVHFLRWVSEQRKLEDAFGAPPPRLPHALRRRILAEYEDSNRAVRRRFPALGPSFGEILRGEEAEEPSSRLPSVGDLVRELLPGYINWAANRDNAEP